MKVGGGEGDGGIAYHLIDSGYHLRFEPGLAGPSVRGTEYDVIQRPAHHVGSHRLRARIHGGAADAAEGGRSAADAVGGVTVGSLGVKLHRRVAGGEEVPLHVHVVEVNLHERVRHR